MYGEGFRIENVTRNTRLHVARKDLDPNQKYLYRKGKGNRTLFYRVEPYSRLKFIGMKTIPQSVMQDIIIERAKERVKEERKRQKRIMEEFKGLTKTKPKSMPKQKFVKRVKKVKKVKKGETRLQSASRILGYKVDNDDLEVLDQNIQHIKNARNINSAKFDIYGEEYVSLYPGSYADEAADNKEMYEEFLNTMTELRTLVRGGFYDLPKKKIAMIDDMIFELEEVIDEINTDYFPELEGSGRKKQRVTQSQHDFRMFKHKFLTGEG